MAESEVIVRYTGDSSNLEAASKRVGQAIDGATKKAAAGADKLDDSLKSVEQEVKKVEEGSKKASSSIKGFEDAANKAGSASSKLAQGLGTVSPELQALATGIADLADGAEGLVAISKSTGLALGAVGAAAAVVAAIAATVALAWVEVQREMALAEEVADTYRQTSESLEPTLRALEDVEIALKVATGEATEAEGKAAEARLAAKRGVEDFADAIRDQTAALQESKESATFWRDLLGGSRVGLDKLVESMFGYNATIAAADEQLAALGDSTEAEAENQATLREKTIELNEATDAKRAADKAAAAGAREAADEERKRAKALEDAAAATKALTDISAASTAKTLDGYAAINFAQGQQLQKIDELIAKGGDLEAADAARAAVNAEANAASAAWLDTLATDMDQAAAELDAVAVAVEAVADKIQDDLMTEISGAITGAVQDIAGAVTDVIGEALSQQLDAVSETQSALQALGENASAADRQRLLKQLDAEKAAALRLFRANKAAQIANATINGAVAVTQALAQLGPIAGAIAAAGIAVATGTQIGIIAAQKPPSFHTGGVIGDPSEQAIVGRKGEAVMTEQGRRAVGLDTARDVARANQGRAGRGSPILEFHVGAYTTERQFLSAAGAGGAMRASTRTLRPSGQQNPYRS